MENPVLYSLSFYAPPAVVGQAFESLNIYDKHNQLSDNVQHWEALATAMREARHYPLDARYASCDRILKTLHPIINPPDPAVITSARVSSGQVSLNLEEGQLALLAVNTTRPDDFHVYLWILPPKVTGVVEILVKNSISVLATIRPDTQELNFISNTDIFA